MPSVLGVIAFRGGASIQREEQHMNCHIIGLWLRWTTLIGCKMGSLLMKFSPASSTLSLDQVCFQNWSGSAIELHFEQVRQPLEDGLDA